MDSAIVAAATLSHRYITDRFLLDKAIDLVDEAASRLRMEVDSKPEELDELDRRIIQMKIEREALKKEDDAASQDRLSKLEEELADLEERSNEITARWRAEKETLASATRVKEELEDARQALTDAERRGDLARASELKYGTIPALEKKLAETERAEDKASSCRKSSTQKMSRASFRAGPAFPSTRCSKASAKSSSTWRKISATASSASARR
ncbi:MAG: hypothetical protein R3C55_07075 [Parvularculaceae bacterium]